MSNVLCHACGEAGRMESDIRQQVLQMPMLYSSRCVTFININKQFINTSPPKERVVLTKPRHVLEDLKDESTDI